MRSSPWTSLAALSRTVAGALALTQALTQKQEVWTLTGALIGHSAVSLLDLPSLSLVAHALLTA
jgi:hypothetical protein